MNLELNSPELELLLAIARWEADAVRDMCTRAGVRPGMRVLDVGCGPRGALVELREIVGASGTVVGLDVSSALLAVAQDQLQVHALDADVLLVQGDINDLEPAALFPPGPFDAAHLRHVLFHQEDPAHTLRQVARVLRPRGHILVYELLDDPRYPWFEPPVPAAERAWSLFYEAIRCWGQAVDVARRMPTVCAEAGLEIVDSRTSTRMPRRPEDALLASHGVLAAVRQGVVDLGLASNAEIDAILEALAAARARAFTRFVPYMYVETILRRP